jgi:sortase A
VGAVIGVVLVATGVVVLGFVPYALYATRGAADSAQTALRHVLPAVTTTGSVTTTASRRTVALVRPPVLTWPATVPLGSAIALLTARAAGVVDDVVVEGDDELRLEEGPGHYPGSALPGQAGNVAIAGHRTTWLRPFYNLQAEAPGDLISLQVGAVIYRYIVRRVVTVSPRDLQVVAPLRGWWLTLTTCNPRYSAAQRLVVRAELTSSDLVEQVRRTERTRTAEFGPVELARVVEPLPAVSPFVLVGWLLAAGVLGLGVAVSYRRRRASVLALLASALCVFEAYGAAARLIPGSW